MMAIKTKVKLRTCEVCGVKKKVAEFSIGKICIKCENSSTRKESTDDEVLPRKEDADEVLPRKETTPREGTDEVLPQKAAKNPSDDLQSLHAKMDYLTQRLDRMEALMMGLMELVGKINYEMEMNKAVQDE